MVVSYLFWLYRPHVPKPTERGCPDVRPDPLLCLSDRNPLRPGAGTWRPSGRCPPDSPRAQQQCRRCERLDRVSRRCAEGKSDRGDPICSRTTSSALSVSSWHNLAFGATKYKYKTRSWPKIFSPIFSELAFNGRISLTRHLSWNGGLKRTRPTSYARPARTRRPGKAPVCSPSSKIGTPATSVALYPSTRCTKRRPPAGRSFTSSG